MSELTFMYNVSVHVPLRHNHRPRGLFPCRRKTPALSRVLRVPGQGSGQARELGLLVPSR